MRPIRVNDSVDAFRSSGSIVAYELLPHESAALELAFNLYTQRIQLEESADNKKVNTFDYMVGKVIFEAILDEINEDSRFLTNSTQMHMARRALEALVDFQKWALESGGYESCSQEQGLTGAEMQAMAASAEVMLCQLPLLDFHTS